MRILHAFLSAVLFGALAAAVGWTLGEFVPLSTVPCEPFSDCANSLGGRYAVWAAIGGAPLGAVYSFVRSARAGRISTSGG